MKPNNTLRSFLALASSSLLAISSASALTYYWDSNNATAGFGTAAGTWAAPTVGIATAGWSLNPAGTTATLGVDVTTATTDDLNFGSGLGTLGYAGTITVSGTVDAGNLTTFSNRAINGTNHITISGGTAINLAAAPIINTVAEDIIFTIGTALTGAGTSLTKTGIGILALSGTNTFAGQLTVAQGVLSINAINNNSTNGTLGNSANAVILGSTGNNGVLRYTGGNAASDKAFTLATGGTGAFDVTTGITLTLNGAIGGGGRLYKTGIGTVLTSASNGYSGGTVVGAGTLSVGAASSLGTDVITNNITIQNSGRLLLDESTNIGSTQPITFSSSSNNAAPVSATLGGAKAGGALAVLGLNYNGLPASISQANTNGGVIAINAVTGYDQDLSTLLTSKNLFLGAIGTSTFTGAAGTVVAGTGDLYRLGGGGGQITFNTTNLFTGAKGVQVGSTSVNGTGTVVISEAQDYSLATTVSGGTLTLSGANGSATGSTGFSLNGGRLFLDSSGTNNSDRIGTVAVNLSNGGEVHLSGNAAGTTETIGNLNLGDGYSTVTAQATTVSSTLAGNAFNRTNNGTALFRGTALGQNAAVQGQVTLSDTTGLSFVGTTTLDNAANGDTSKDVKIIPYLVGATAFNGTGDTFVTYDTTLGFRVLNTTNQFTVNAFTAGNNTRLTSGQTGIASATINSLILSNSGTSTIADGATLTVSSGAILVQAGNGTINQAGTTGILDFGSNTGYFTTINTFAIGAQLTGSGGLVKSGAGQLQLTNVNNSFTGDIILNAGTLNTSGGTTSTNGLLGDAANNIVVNGNATWSVAPNQTYTRGITINNGAILTFGNNGTTTFTRNITGTGGINVTGGFSNGMVFSGTGNTFEGPILLAGQGNNNYETRASFASLADSSTANGRIVFSTNNASRADGSQFAYTGATDLILANRQIELASTINSPTFGHQLRSAGAGTLSVSTDLIVSTPIAQTLHLRGTNTGANTFSGKIVDGDGKVSLTKSEAGRWILSGANTYTGNTTITGGTLELADNAQLKFVLGSTSGTNNSITGTAGTVVLAGDFVIDTSAADALASGTWTLENVSTLAGPYGSTFTVVGFTNAGSDTWTKVNGAKTYTFDETTGILTLAPTAGGSAYDTWATSKGLTGLPGSSTDPAKDADPDNDGSNNLAEFAFNGDPLSGSDNGLVAGLVQNISAPAGNEQTLVVAVRDDATFSSSGSPAVQTATVDDVTYTIQGTLDLVTIPGSAVSKIGGASNTAPPATGLPDLTGTAWEYHTFKLDASEGLPGKGFLRAKVTSP